MIIDGKVCTKTSSVDLEQEDDMYVTDVKQPLTHLPASTTTSFKRGLTVELNLVLYVLAHSSTHQVIEQLIYSILSEQHGVQSIVRLDQDKIPCSNNHSDPNTRIRMLIQHDASYWLTYMRIFVAVPSIITAFVWGNISDRMPRKLPILLPLIANVLLIFLVIIVVLYKLPISPILFGYFLEGLGGSTSTFFMGCYAYLGHISTKENRTSRINVNEICIILSSSAATFILGNMLKSQGFLVPFLVILCLYVTNILYTLYILPDIQVDRSKLKTDQKIECSALLTMYTKERQGNGRTKLCCWGFVYFLFVFTSIARGSVNMLFIQNQPFCWNARNIGIYFSTGALLMACWNILVLYVLHRRLGDMGVLIIAQIASVAGMVITAFSKTKASLYSGIKIHMIYYNKIILPYLLLIWEGAEFV